MEEIKQVFYLTCASDQGIPLLVRGNLVSGANADPSLSLGHRASDTSGSLGAKGSTLKARSEGGGESCQIRMSVGKGFPSLLKSSSPALRSVPTGPARLLFF